jgi:hypothetical protein
MKKKPIFPNYSEPKNTCTPCGFIEKKVHKDGDFKGMQSHDFHVIYGARHIAFVRATFDGQRL